MAKKKAKAIKKKKTKKKVAQKKTSETGKKKKKKGVSRKSSLKKVVKKSSQKSKAPKSQKKVKDEVGKKSLKTESQETPKKKPRKRKKSEALIEREWLSQKDNMDEENVNPYKMTGSYEQSMAINHPTFGMGFVTSVFPNKIQVTFKDSIRFLVHNRKQ